MTDITVAVVPITKDNCDTLVRVAMSMYIGEHCDICGKEYKTLADLHDVVCAGQNPLRFACSECWAGRPR